MTRPGTPAILAPVPITPENYMSLARFILDGPDASNPWLLALLLWPWFILTLLWFAWDTLAVIGFAIGLPFVALARFIRHWWVIHLNPLYRLNKDGSIVRIKVGA